MDKLLSKRWFYLLLLLLINLVVVWNWYSVKLPIGHGDEDWLYDPSLLTEQLLYVWDTHSFGAGSYNYSVAQIFPITVFWLLLKSWGLTLWVIQYLWFFLMMFLPGIAVFLLLEYLLNTNFSTQHVAKNKSSLYIACFIGAYFYSYNILLVQLQPFQPHLKPIMIGLPLMILLYLRGLTKKKYYYIALAAFLSLIFAQSNLNFAHTLPVFAIFLLITIFWIYFEKENTLTYIKFFLFFFISILLINLWWLVPLLMSSVSSTSDAILQNLSSFSSVGGRSMSDYLRLIGFWAWDLGTTDYNYFPFHTKYESIFLLLTGYTFMALSILAVIVKPTNITKFFLSLLVIGVFLSKGTQEPFGFIFKFMYERIPLFLIFRDPFSKFGIYIVLSCTVLLSFTLFYLFSKFVLIRKYRYIVLICASGLVSFYSFPLFTGEFLRHSNDNYQRSSLVKVPNHWIEFQQQKHENVFSGFPMYYGSQFDWEYGFNGRPLVLFSKGNIYAFNQNSISRGQTLLNSAYTDLISHEDILLPRFLTLFNIEKVVVPNDLILDPVFKERKHQYIGRIFVKESDGELSMYKTESLPKIYFSSQIISTPEFGSSWYAGLSLFPEYSRPVFTSYSSATMNASYLIEPAVEASERLMPGEHLNMLTQALPAEIRKHTHLIYKHEVTEESDYAIKLKFPSFTQLEKSADYARTFVLTVIRNDGTMLFTKNYSLSSSSIWTDLEQIHLTPDRYLFFYSYDNAPYRNEVDIKSPIYDDTLANLEIVDDGILFIGNSHKSNFLYKLENFNSNRKYLIDIELIDHSGVLEVISFQRDDPSTIFEAPVLHMHKCGQSEVAQSACKGRIILKWEPLEYSTSAYFGFVVYSESEDVLISQPAEAHIKSVVIEEYPEPELALVRKGNQTSNTEFPEITYTEVNPTKYVLNFNNTTNLDKGILVFTNSYHPAWKLKIGNKQIADSRHIKVNGYANGWIVNASDIENTNLELEFEYQKYFEIAVIISIASFICLCFYSVYGIFKRK